MRKIIEIAAGAALLGTIGITAPAAQAAATPCSAQAKACLRLSTNQAWLTNNGQVTRGPVPVTVGMPGYETPTGKFKVQYRDVDHHSKAYDAPMPSHADAVAFYQTLRTGPWSR